MAKICLIYPRDLNMHFFPIGLGYIAAFLKEKGHQVIFLDISKNDLPLLQNPQIVGCDLIGLSITTPQLGLAEKVINILKGARKELPIVAGGVHPSFFKGQLIQDLNIDYVIYGEGELTLNELVNALQQNKDHLSSINGLVFKEEKEIITNPPREVIPDLDILPFPARDLVNFESYLTTYQVNVTCKSQKENQVRILIMRNLTEDSIEVRSVKSITSREPGNIDIIAEIYASSKQNETIMRLISALSVEKDIVAVSWEITGHNSD